MVESRGYRESGMFMVRSMVLEERTSRWPWLLDKRIRSKYFNREEDARLFSEAASLYEEEEGQSST